MTDHHGWKNRATWNVVLWLENDEKLYQQAQAKRHQLGSFTAATARRFVNYLWPTGKTPDGDSLRCVNWQEVAEALNE